MKFLHTFIDSLTKKEFYASVIRGEKKIGFGYLFKLQIIAALFLTIIFSIQLSTVLPFFDSFAREVLPPNAEIIIQNGKLKSNTNPIIIPFGDKLDALGSEETRSEATVKNILVLDVTSSTTPQDLQQKDTLILVTADGVVLRSDTGRYSTSFFENAKDLNVTIDEAWLVAKVDWAKNFAKYVPFIMFFFLLASLYIGALLASLLYGFGTWLIFKLLKRPQSFKTSFSVAAYSRTFATILGLLTFMIPFIGSNLILIPLEILFIIMMIKDVRKPYASEEGEKNKSSDGDSKTGSSEVIGPNDTPPAELKR